MTENLTQGTNKIAAIIILYFPDMKLLKRLLNSVHGQVTHIFVIDNTPSISLAGLSQSWFESESYDVTYHALGDNYGIAKAQNVGIEFAIKADCDHIILFDQDSVIPAKMIQELLSAEMSLLSESVQVGSIGPLFLDEKTGKYSKAMRQGYIRVNVIDVSPMDTEPVKTDHLIASGSLIRTDVLKVIGLMREDLFIDWVDIEWGLRGTRLGYSHFIVPTAIMRHSIGDDFAVVGNRNITLHNDIRNYYIIRNACHLLLDPQIGRKWRTDIILRIPIYIIAFTLCSKNRLNTFKTLLRACLDGFSGRLGKAF